MNTLQNLFLSNEDETLNREVKAYQEKLTSKTNEIPIWERQWLTIEEASEYSGIARRKLRELSVALSVQRQRIISSITKTCRALV